MSGITYDYMEEYIRGLIPESEGRIKQLEDFAKENGVPIAQKETIKFLEWVVTSEAGLKALAMDMGYVAPFKKAIKTDNVLYDYIDKANELGKTNINWLFTYTPNTEAWRNGVVDSLALYSANPTNESWIKVRSSIVDGWAEQYRLSHQK